MPTSQPALTLKSAQQHPEVRSVAQPKRKPATVLTHLFIIVGMPLYGVLLGIVYWFYSARALDKMHCAFRQQKKES